MITGATDVTGSPSEWLKALAKSAVLFGLLVLLTFLVSGYFHASKSGRRVNLFIWSTYLAPDTLRNFTERTGIEVEYDLYDSNEALLAKLQSGNVEYDVVVPSDYMVESLIRQNLLANINKGKLPNLKHVDPQFFGLAFDPDGRYSVPFIWGTTAIGYRKDKVKKVVDSWKILWDKEYANRIIMLDDMREDLGAALKSLGYSLNSTKPAEIRQARDLLMKQKPLVKEYNSSNFQDLLISGDAWLAHGYNGQIAKAAREFPNIGYAIPKEGCTRSMDNLCIPRSGPHPEEALALINYLLEPDVAASLCQYTSYSPANKAARAFLTPDVLANDIIFPDPAGLSHCEYVRDIGPTVTLYDRYWTEVKSR